MGTVQVPMGIDLLDVFFFLQPVLCVLCIAGLILVPSFTYYHSLNYALNL